MKECKALNCVNPFDAEHNAVEEQYADGSTVNKRQFVGRGFVATRV
jgi:hypothetical protein